MRKKNFFTINRLREKLWFKPVLFCLFSVAAALMAKVADDSKLNDIVPKITKDSLEELLTTISASMLVIAIFAVGSMLAAFSAASGTATPRSFKLIVSDDVSQNALSVFIGSFIYSIVATVALKNGYYGKAGDFILFIVTLLVFVFVIFTFLRWVERIAKLGRLGHTIKKVEEATINAIKKQFEAPRLGGVPVRPGYEKGNPVYCQEIGYVQQIDLNVLQKLAEKTDATITVNCLPGSFTAPDKPLVFINRPSGRLMETDRKTINEAFIIGQSRLFDEDPRFGLIALSEIASRALSPSINDPGTAIAIIGSHIRMFSLLINLTNQNIKANVTFNRIEVPELSLQELFDDAFRPIARDGANNIEVMFRLQKALISIAANGNAEIKRISLQHSLQAFKRSELAIDFKDDLIFLKQECLFSKVS